MDELLALLRNNPTYIKELLNGKTYVGEIIGKPSLSPVMKVYYSLHIRSLTRDPRLSIIHGAAEVILETGEILPVTVVMDAHNNPTPQAWESGFWTIWDRINGIKDTDLSAEQVPLVRWFMQRQQKRALRGNATSAFTDEARWRQEVRIKHKVLQEAERLGMKSAEFDHLVAQRNGYIKELKALFGDNLPEDVKPYMQHPPKPANLRQ